ncbi:hypothetical protein HY485_05130 [Candidatus Woesearchaeota archaeon]|nr:hypothetical protein [Candidatus Woesearchaeota archaeon]
MPDKRTGNWDFANFFQRLPEPTEAEKQAYAYHKIMSNTHKPQQQKEQPIDEQISALTEDERNGMITFEDRKLCLTYSPFAPEPTTPTQLFSRYKKFETTEQRLMMVKHRRKLEETLAKTYIATNFVINSFVPGVLVTENSEICVAAIGVINFSAKEKIEAVLFRPTQKSKTTAYQINNKTLDKIIGAGFLYATNTEEIKIYEIKKCLAIE